MSKVSYMTFAKGGCCIGLAQVRKERGYTQDQLARLSGVARVTIARYETGRTQPNVRTLQKLAATLKVRLDSLVDRKAV